MNKISIIFPVYNEANRLNKLFNNLKRFQKKRFNITFQFIFVDDGSIDKTSVKIKKFFNEFKKSRHKYKLIKSNKNFGKGHALKLGMKIAKYNWIFTMDADLSVELNQIIKWIKKYKFLDSHAYFGSRNLPQSTQKYLFYRRFIGKIWQTIFFLFVDSKIKDTQCGFKLYNKKYAKKIFKLLNENGFAHDVELFFLLKKKNIQIIELPVKWVHADGSKLNPIFEPIRFFFKFWILLTKYKLKLGNLK